MLKNRSVPAGIVLPHLTCQNVTAAIDWLTECSALSSTTGTAAMACRLRPNAPRRRVDYAGEGAARACSPARIGCNTQSLTVFVEDVDAHFEKSKAMGAQIVEDLHETMYRERQYGVKDPEGRHWLFSRHARDVSPDEWGAEIAG